MNITLAIKQSSCYCILIRVIFVFLSHLICRVCLSVLFCLCLYVYVYSLTSGGLGGDVSDDVRSAVVGGCGSIGNGGCGGNDGVVGGGGGGCSVGGSGGCDVASGGVVYLCC